MCFPLESIIKGFDCECRKYVSIHAEKVVMFQTSWRKTLAIQWYLPTQKSDIKISREFSMAIYNQKEVLSLPYVINFRSGWELAVSENKLFSRDYPNNHFQSMISAKKSDQNPDFSMIINYNHSHVHKQFNTVNVVNHIPMWLIVVHDQNVGNTIKGNLLEDSQLELLQKYFGIKNRVSLT